MYSIELPMNKRSPDAREFWTIRALYRVQSCSPLKSARDLADQIEVRAGHGFELIERGGLGVGARIDRRAEVERGDGMPGVRRREQDLERRRVCQPVNIPEDRAHE
jgi:hypothetical protein